MLRLYDYPQCPFCRKVRIALAEKGIKYEKVPVDLRKKEQKNKDFLKLNPYGKVPVIVDDGAVIYESTVINEYLDEKYPEPHLMPSDPQNRARVRILVDFCESHFHTPWFNIYRQMLFKSENERDKELIGKSKDEIREHLRYLNRELEGHEYLMGFYSLADIAFTPRIALLDQFGIEIDPEFENVRRWMDKIRLRASFKALEL